MSHRRPGGRGMRARTPDKAGTIPPTPPGGSLLQDDLNSGGAGANADIQDDLNSGGGGANADIEV